MESRRGTNAGLAFRHTGMAPAGIERDNVPGKLDLTGNTIFRYVLVPGREHEELTRRHAVRHGGCPGRSILGVTISNAEVIIAEQVSFSGHSGVHNTFWILPGGSWLYEQFAQHSDRRDWWVLAYGSASLRKHSCCLIQDILRRFVHVPFRMLYFRLTQDGNITFHHNNTLHLKL